MAQSLIADRYAGAATTATIGVVNFASVRGDVAATLAKIEANIREAAAQGVDILVFPEEALTETVPGPSTERIAALCAEHDLYVAAFIGPDGIQGTYRTLHLGSLPWVTEGVTFTPGDRPPVFETRFGPVGIQICYDFWLKGARIILNCCGTFAGPGKLDYMTQTTATRAQENLCYVASSNHVGGEDRGSSSYGAGAVDEGRAADMLSRSTIAGPAFPRFSQVLAPISQLIADEFALLAKGEQGPGPS